MAKEEKKKKKDEKEKKEKKIWAEIRKEVKANVAGTVGEGWACHKPTVLGFGALGALLGIAASEGMWWVFAPGSRGSIGHIASDVAGGTIGAAGGSTSGLFVARNQFRNQKAVARTDVLRMATKLADISPEAVLKSVKKSELPEELELFFGRATADLLVVLAKEDPDEFKLMVDSVAEELGGEIRWSIPPNIDHIPPPPA